MTAVIVTFLKAIMTFLKAVFIVALLLPTPAAARERDRNNILGQNQWCYVSQGDVMFCDYITLSSCRAAHKDGDCVRR